MRKVLLTLSALVGLAPGIANASQEVPFINPYSFSSLNCAGIGQDIKFLDDDDAQMSHYQLLAEHTVYEGFLPILVFAERVQHYNLYPVCFTIDMDEATARITRGNIMHWLHDYCVANPRATLPQVAMTIAAMPEDQRGFGPLLACD